MRLVALAGWLLLLPLAHAQTVDDWLLRMGEALHDTDYAGTLIYMDGERMEMMRIFHSASEDRERVVTLSGPHREVIREGRSVTCIGLGRPATIYDDLGLSALTPVARALVGHGSSHYRIEAAGVDRAAGRPAQRIEVRAADNYRYGYRLWLDEATGFPLRVSLLDSGGEVIEDLAFTDIQLNTPPDPADLEPQSDQALRRVSLPPPADVDATGSPLPAFANVPGGFSVRSHERNEQGEEHWVFSDGLASVSVYVKPVDSLVVAERETRTGAVNGKLIQRGGQRVYAMGKVPAEAVAHLARSLVERAVADTGG